MIGRCLLVPAFVLREPCPRGAVFRTSRRVGKILSRTTGRWWSRPRTTSGDLTLAGNRPRNHYGDILVPGGAADRSVVTSTTPQARRCCDAGHEPQRHWA